LGAPPIWGSEWVFLAALGGLFRTLFSDYRQLRARLGLTRYSEAAMIEKLGLAGFSAKRAALNIGHTKAEWLFTHN
jgi:hypothetical protein